MIFSYCDDYDHSPLDTTKNHWIMLIIHVSSRETFFHARNAPKVGYLLTIA